MTHSLSFAYEPLFHTPPHQIIIQKRLIRFNFSFSLFRHVRYVHGILYEYPRAGRFFLHYPLPALYRSKFYSDYHCAANNQFACFQNYTAESSFPNLRTKTTRKTHYLLSRFSKGYRIATHCSLPLINYKLPIIFRRYFDEYVQTGRSDHPKRKDYRKREFIGKRKFHDGSAAKIYGIASADGYEEV